MRKQPFHIVLVFSLTFNDDSYVKETQTELEIGLLIIALYGLVLLFPLFFIFPFFSPFFSD